MTGPKYMEEHYSLLSKHVLLIERAVNMAGHSHKPARKTLPSQSILPLHERRMVDGGLFYSLVTLHETKAAVYLLFAFCPRTQKCVRSGNIHIPW